MDSLDYVPSNVETRSHSSGGGFQVATNKDNVKVIIRVRPLNEREKSNGGSKKCVTIENNQTVCIEQKPEFKSFNFDFVGDEEIHQETIFKQIAQPIADYCLEGYNGSIFAYGQTGAGKTFTIQGPSIIVNGEETIYSTFRKENGQEQEKRGIMQRSFEYIFDSIETEREKAANSNDQCHFESLIRCSYLEIYNEQIMDLLDPSSINLHIREDIKKGVYVEGLQEEVVQSADDMIGIIQTGAKNRHVGSTSMNKESSRSHSVLTTIIETKSMKDGGVWNIKTSRFHIIDLAGSERSKYTNAVGERLKEAGMINKSLSALGNVINSLVDISEGKNRHVHYRDSKLTFLLRDSLGGNSKTVIIANISPSSLCYGETVSTLKFAQRAKLIRNRAIVNEDSSGTIQLLKSEISRLKKDLAESEKRTRQIDGGPNGFQCQVCKSTLNFDGNTEDEDEMLLDPLTAAEEIRLSALNESTILDCGQKEKIKSQRQDQQKLSKRVVHLESLLSANLDNLTSQQKYYDCEVQKGQAQIKKLQLAVDSYEKQCARDKMIIKFREDRIAKLESGHPPTSEDQQKIVADLKKEIQLWKEAADHNSQAAKLFAEKAELQKQLEQLKNEIKQTPDSLGAQMRSLTELNDGLNTYLKKYCEESKIQVENELSQVKLDYAEKIEELNEKINSLKEAETLAQEQNELKEVELQKSLSHANIEIERLNSDYQREKLEIERLNKESIEKVKIEIQQVSENKSEQEKELQMLSIQMLEKEQAIERERDNRIEVERISSQKFAELTDKIIELQRQTKAVEVEKDKQEERMKQSIQELETLIDKERQASMIERKFREEKFEQEVRDIEQQLISEQSEKQQLEEQNEQFASRIQHLEEENDTMQQGIIFKEEQIQELQNNVEEKQVKVSQLDQELKSLLLQTQEYNAESQQTISQLQSQIEQLNSELSDLNTQLTQAKQDKAELEQAVVEIENEKGILISEKEELQSKLSELQTKFDLNISKIQLLEDQIQVLNTECDNYKQEKVQLQQTIQENNFNFDQAKQQNEVEIQLVTQQLFETEKTKSEIIQQLNEQMQSSGNNSSLLEQMISNLNIEIKTQQSHYEQQLVQYEYNFQQKLQQLNGDNQVIKDLQSKQEQEIEMLKSQHQGQIEQLKVQVQDKENTFQEILIKVKNSHEVEKSALIEQHQIKIENIVQEHNQQVIQHKEMIEELHINVTSQEQQRSQLQQELEQAFDQIEQLNDTYSQSIETLTDEKSELTKVIEQKEGKEEQSKHVFEQEIISLKQQVQIIQSQKEQETSQLQQLVEEVKIHSQSEVSEQVSQVFQQKETIVKQLQEAQASFKISQDESHKEKLILEGQLDNLTQQRNELTHNLEQQYLNLQALEKELQTTTYRFEIVNEEISKLKAQNADVNQQFVEKESECEQLTKEFQKLKQQISSMSFESNSTSLQIQQLENQCQQLYDQNQDLEANLNNWINEAGQANEEVMKLNNVISQKEEQEQYLNIVVKEKDSTIDCHRMIHEKLQQEYKQVMQEWEQDKKQIESLSSNIKALQLDYSKQQITLDSKICEINTEHIRKYQEKEADHQYVKQEVENYKAQVKEFQSQVSKQKQRNDELISVLKVREDTMALMTQKESELLKELDIKDIELKDTQEKTKKRLIESKEEKDALKREWEKSRKKVENLKDLIKLKETQIEEQQAQDERSKDTYEKALKETKDLKVQLSKREFEMKDVFRTLKFYSDEKSRLEKELEKLHRENDQLIGHKNPSQKIQHHVKIKEENNKLREENFKLQEDLRRKNEMITKNGIKKQNANELSPTAFDSRINQQQQQQDSDAQLEMKKLKKENMTNQEIINRLVDHILSQPGLNKVFDISDEQVEKNMQSNGTIKIKMAMEIISQVNNVIQQREREVKDMEREKKKIEYKLDIVEKEKVLCKQQLELMHNQSMGGGISVTSQQPKRQTDDSHQEYLLNHNSSNPDIESLKLKHQRQQYMIQEQQKQQNFQQHQQQIKSRIQVEGFTSGDYPKQSPPVANLKLLKEKENLNSKRDLYGGDSGGFRSGSGRRQAYLSNNGGQK